MLLRKLKFPGGLGGAVALHKGSNRLHRFMQPKHSITMNGEPMATASITPIQSNWYCNWFLVELPMNAKLIDIRMNSLLDCYWLACIADWLLDDLLWSAGWCFRESWSLWAAWVQPWLFTKTRAGYTGSCSHSIAMNGEPMATASIIPIAV